jgi:lipopolysaccharide export system permease protein
VRILDRYVTRNFLVPFIYCFLGFLAIWLVFDLSDNGPDFIEAKVPLRKVIWFYSTQFPQIAIISLPVGLLLALLYSLSRMSRSNEIISMLVAGRSILRILRPLIFAGIVAALVALALNYSLAPHAEGAKKAILDRMVHGSEKKGIFDGQLFRDRSTGRTWYVQHMRLNPSDMQGLLIVQQDQESNIVRKYYARRAAYNPENKVWTLERGKTSALDADGNLASDQYWRELQLADWTETPWRIASSNLEAQDLSVPELRDYVRYNSDFPEAQLAPYRTHLHYRWALPWSCLVVVFIGAPLGIVYSRRGVLAGVASSVFIFFGMIFLTNLFLALGKGARVSPGIAAWSPNALFGAIGLFLLWLRSTNREMPKWNFRKAKSSR